MIRPLMPKGVEHIDPYQAMLDAMTVIRPLMPKGVEHLTVRAHDLSRDGDPSVDAERR